MIVTFALFKNSSSDNVSISSAISFPWFLILNCSLAFLIANKSKSWMVAFSIIFLVQSKFAVALICSIFLALSGPIDSPILPYGYPCKEAVVDDGDQSLVNGAN